MPELPEVETVAQGLRRRALGRRISAVEVRHASIIVGSAEEFVSTVEGRTLAVVSRKGKAIAVELAGGDGSEARYLLVRLGMTGQLTVAPHDAPVEPHTHVFMTLDDGREELRFRDARRFGRLRSLTKTELETVLGAIGPDAQRVTEPQFLAAMNGRKGAIKSWLMNQNLVAGLGNIYADEALFEARIHPLAQPGRVSLAKAHAAVQGCPQGSRPRGAAGRHDLQRLPRYRGAAGCVPEKAEGLPAHRRSLPAMW